MRWRDEKGQLAPGLRTCRCLVGDRPSIGTRYGLGDQLSRFRGCRCNRPRQSCRGRGMLTAGLETSAAIIIGLMDAPLTERETSVSLPSGMVQIRLKDEGGRIDINKAPVKVLASLLRTVGADDVDTIVQGIEGWRAIVDDSLFAETNSALSNSTTSLCGETDRKTIRSLRLKVYLWL